MVRLSVTWCFSSLWQRSSSWKKDLKGSGVRVRLRWWVWDCQERNRYEKKSSPNRNRLTRGRKSRSRNRNRPKGDDSTRNRYMYGRHCRRGRRDGYYGSRVLCSEMA